MSMTGQVNKIPKKKEKKLKARLRRRMLDQVGNYLKVHGYCVETG